MRNNFATKQMRDKDQLYNKLETSVNTATSNNCLMVKPSLLQCSSSVSIQQSQTKNKMKDQKQLFIKYLSTKEGSQHRKKIFQRMLIMHEKVEGSSIGAKSLELHIQQARPHKQRAALEYFCRMWLDDMGYKNQKNKMMVLERVRMQIPDNQLYIAIVFYEKLGQGLMSNQDQLKLMFQTCKNGWQYMCGQIIKYCTMTSKNKNHCPNL